ncbi:MAG: ATP-dependent zinc protease [Methylohalobius sp. ZOD2]|nr:ATP-dependent zinc protease [Methylothermaceae bacterium]
MGSLLNRSLMTSLAIFLWSEIAGGADTLGWIEKIQIEPWGVEVKAKLDTGALTSSLDAKDIQGFEREGEKWVRFTVNLRDEDSGKRVSERIERPLYRKFIAKGAGGRVHRLVVLMKVCIGERLFQDQFSLRDRDDMLYPVLLGRRTIQHLGKIDVTRTFLHEPACDDDSPVVKAYELEDDEDIGLD